jgi:hypothetical protein
MGVTSARRRAARTFFTVCRKKHSLQSNVSFSSSTTATPEQRSQM